MKLVLVGYGRMGQAVEEIATKRGHDIIAKFDPLLPTRILDSQILTEADVAIEFSTPKTAPQNIEDLAKAGINTVSGTTGWYDHLPQTTATVNATSTGLIYAPNFSLGVHIVQEIAKFAGQMSNFVMDYEVTIHESHHKHKVDEPSGTAITIANTLVDQIYSKNKWASGSPPTQPDSDTLYITSTREGENPGSHVIRFENEHERIEIAHQASSRDGFALGAVLAAEWIVGKVGVFTLRDMFPREDTR